jgi:hypothetical protein
LLDPPYASEAERAEGLYSQDDLSVSVAVREWAIEWGNDPRMRIAMCGYEGEHTLPDSWECVHWKAGGGYGSQGDNQARANSGRERIWFSPHCLRSGFQFPEPKYELPRLQTLWDSGHPDRAGIELAIEDNIAQDAADALGLRPGEKP